MTVLQHFVAASPGYSSIIADEPSEFENSNIDMSNLLPMSRTYMFAYFLFLLEHDVEARKPDRCAATVHSLFFSSASHKKSTGMILGPLQSRVGYQ